MTLYELREEYKAVLAMMEDPDADMELIQDTLEGLDGDIEEKVEGYGTMLEQLESDIARLDAEAKRMQNRRIVIENRKDRLRENLLKAMLETDKKSIKTDHYTVTVKQTPYRLVVDDPFGVPEEYYEPQPAKLDKTRLKAALQEQLEQNGFIQPFAHLERSHTIQIK
jgi:hypothetical protein